MPAPRSTLPKEAGAPALRRARRARRPGADPRGLRAAGPRIAAGRPVRPARRQPRRRPRRQDPRRDLQPLRQPGRAAGGDDGARARRRPADRGDRVPGARGPRRCGRLGRRVLHRPVGPRPPPRAPSRRSTTPRCGRSGSPPCPTGCGASASPARASTSTCSGSRSSRPSSRRALDHFRLRLRAGTTLNDLACGVASLVEGAWLNQCLTARHPSEPSAPIAETLRRSGRLLWRGAVEPRP